MRHGKEKYKRIPTGLTVNLSYIHTINQNKFDKKISSKEADGNNFFESKMLENQVPERAIKDICTSESVFPSPVHSLVSSLNEGLSMSPSKTNTYGT